ncbi:response regulator transcription factor [Halalkalibacterium halodurans]|uniref:response regulator transcription factor n=1 Tax=Halalkalibacterium halodurans TaxID=86665 RepID=UPI002E21FE87|nr:response regulator transcription factor [Halalkalibacterium halodurans]MED4084111.1 response regulator transcription factor [Halalkalibacterium halodurans]MED4104589.1 response regulator transcription factor [Halalkalibacterium halodurans]MED4108317.1 response regulator transcription factor [Halalkalibacterium halodurans]MED4147338.1 response regulator transcription factor [Halalkalibacterium halodurans]
MKILLLEDEEAIRGFITINLKRSGMTVSEADTGERALALVEQGGPFDIALLDVMLPTISGFDVCRQLRERFPHMGIIMLTAKAQEEDKIHGLELGADDYVQKPFSPGELIARIRSLYRRMGAFHSPQTESNDSSVDIRDHESIQLPSELRSGPFHLLIQERRFYKNEVEIVLTPTEWSLVKLLMEREGEGVSRNEILTEIWGRYYTGELKVVDVNIRRIRQKIEPNAADPKFLETIWGFGYRWKRGKDE